MKAITVNSSSYEQEESIFQCQLSSDADSVFKNIFNNLLSSENLFNLLTLNERKELAKKLLVSEKVHECDGILDLINQSPFNDPILLKKWYAHQQLNEGKLAFLCSNHWLNNININKNWLKKEKKLPLMESPILSKLNLDNIKFISSEVNIGIVKLTLKLKAIINKQHDCPVDADELILAFSPVLIDRLEKLSGVTTKYLTEKFTLVQSEEESYRVKLFNLFPLLSLQLSQVIDHWVIYTAEFAENFTHDYHEIKNVFFKNNDIGQFDSIENEVGDTHNQGRYSFICKFNCGKKLAYKPRSLDLDNQFYQFIDFVSTYSDVTDFYKPIYLCRKDYGWMEYIDKQACSTEKQIADYYYRSGSLLSILYLLNAEDIHHKNVIAKQDYPVIVDLETLFHQRDDNVCGPRVNPLNHTVLKTHFIPQYESATPAQELAAIISTKDNNANIFRSSLPMLWNRTIPVNDYVGLFIKGFEISYMALAKIKEKLPSQLNKFLGMNARYVARPTRVYSQLRVAACQPYFQQSALLSDFIYEKLWLDVKKRPFLTSLIECEKTSLLQNDIPLLSHVIGTKSISIENKLIATDFFAHDSFTAVLDKLKHMSMKDCTAQVKIIERSLRLGQDFKDSIIKKQFHYTSAHKKFGWLKQTKTIAQTIVKQASIQEKSVFWPVYKNNQNGLLCLDSTNYRLYDGVLGLLFYLAYINKVCPGFIEPTLLEKTSHDVFHSLLTDNFEEDGCGAFNGLGGVVYVISHLLNIWEDEPLLDIGNCFIHKLSKLVSQDTVFDVQAGSAGAILCLLSYYDVTENRYALTVAEAFGGHLVKAFTTNKERSGWRNSNIKGAILTGFSHGSAGIAYSLIRLYQITENKKYRDIALKAIAFEQTTYSDEIGNWLDFRFDSFDEQKKQAMSAWCSGSMGIGYSRFMMLGLVDEKFDQLIMPDIKRAADNLWKNTTLEDHGLCHGNFGNQEFLHQLLLNQSSISIANEAITLEKFTNLINQYLCELNENGLYEKKDHFESLGLMNGLSGIGYQILKSSFPDSLPSILMLQPPCR